MVHLKVEPGPSAPPGPTRRPITSSYPDNEHGRLANPLVTAVPFQPVPPPARC